jgi:hypothetical protein
MKKIENTHEVENTLNVQFGVILEERASSLTQGRPGPGSEGYYQSKW